MGGCWTNPGDRWQWLWDCSSGDGKKYTLEGDLGRGTSKTSWLEKSSRIKGYPEDYGSGIWISLLNYGTAAGPGSFGLGVKRRMCSSMSGTSVGDVR